MKKAFILQGVGFFQDGKWTSVCFNVGREVELPDEINLPFMGNLPEGVEVTMGGLEIVKRPQIGMNPISGFIVCESREKAVELSRMMRDRIESGDQLLTPPDETQKTTEKTPNFMFSGKKDNLFGNN